MKMIPRKHPSELSERQIQRRVAAEKARFYKEVEDRLAMHSCNTYSTVEKDVQKSETTENFRLGQSEQFEEQESRSENDDINFKCLFNYLCRDDLDEETARISEDFQTQSANFRPDPQIVIDEILSKQNRTDLFDFFDIILKMQADEQEEEIAHCEDGAIYLDYMMLQDKKDKQFVFMNDIRSLFIKYIRTIPHTFINEMLAKLREVTGYPFPKDARTFLKTPRSSVTHEVGNGEYCHYGVEKALIEFLKAYKKEGVESDCIRLIANMGGACLANSSEENSYIISVSETSLKLVEVVGIYLGKEGKPKDSNDLVRMFVHEITALIKNGITFEGKLYKVRLHCLVCDAPAKAYILKEKLYSGYFSCTKCTIMGDYENKLFFPTRMHTNNMRTDEDFFNQKYEPKNSEFDEFQLGETIMKYIPHFGCITCVVLDYMHLVLLGILLKLIDFYIEKSKAVLSEYERQLISERLSAFKEYITSDFSRNPRGFKNVRRLWKAHELRTFLLYTGPIALYKILPEDLYLNFLCLHVVVSILVNPVLCDSEEYLKYAEDLLISFVNTYEKCYGEFNMVFNVHNTIHLVDDVRKFGPLDNFSAFLFENHIMKIKQLLRKGNYKLQQIGNRLTEIRVAKEYVDDEDIAYTNFVMQPKMKEIEVVKKKSFKIDCRNQKDKYVLLNDGSYLECHFFIKGEKEQVYVVGCKFQSSGYFYKYPMLSSNLYINKIERTGTNKIEYFPYENIVAKVCIIPLENLFVAVPIIHTFNKF